MENAHGNLRSLETKEDNKSTKAEGGNETTEAGEQSVELRNECGN